MMSGMKTPLILIALALLAGLVVLGSRKGEPVAPSDADTSAGPWFEVHVVKPRSARPLFGLLPDGLFGLPPSELVFDHASPGARIGSVEHDHLELGADGWNLLIETDADGEVAPGSRLAFPLELGGRQLTLRCRPADRPSGHLRTTTRADSGELDGDFLVEFTTCAIAGTGKVIEWPPAPLSVRGSFAGLPPGGR